MPGKADYTTFYMERYPHNIRWSRLLQNLLGDQYYIIEEGLNGRTTNIDYPDISGRNGKSYLLPCLYTHAPLDLVIFMLGANDLKKIFHRKATDIAKGLEELIQLTQATLYGSDMQSPPKIMLIGYPVISHEDRFEQYGDPLIFEGAIAKSQQFDTLYSKLAAEYGCYYLNVAPYIQLSEIDGIHLDEQGHLKLSELVAQEVKKIFI